jgi:hypothetical protein
MCVTARLLMLNFESFSYLSEEPKVLCLRAMYCPSMFSERLLILELIHIGAD